MVYAWGHFYIKYTYWVCAARKTPIISPKCPLRSINYHFHKMTKQSPLGASSLNLLPLRRPSFSKFLYRKQISSHSSPPTAGLLQPLRSAGQSASQMRPILQSVPETPHSRSSSIRSPALIFHARARSGPPPPFFLLCRGTYLPTFWASHPPPPPYRPIPPLTNPGCTTVIGIAKGHKGPMPPPPAVNWIG